MPSAPPAAGAPPAGAPPADIPAPSAAPPHGPETAGAPAPHGVVHPAIRFALDLARALQRYGAPAHRIEDMLDRVSDRLGIEGEFYATPTALFASFGPPGAAHTSVIRESGGEIALGKLAAIDSLTDAVLDGDVDAATAVGRLREIIDGPASFARPTVVFAFGVVSASVARLFGGGWPEILTAAFIGLVIGLLSLNLTRMAAGARVFELVAAFVATVMAQAAARLWGDVSVPIATVAGLIVLVPGLTLTVATAEVATRHLVTGTARMTAAVVVFMQMGLGVGVAERLVTAAFGPLSPATVAPLPWWTEPIAVGVGAAALVAIFQAPRRRVGWILAASFLALYGARAGAIVLGPAMGAFAGSFLLVAACNLYARALRRTAMVPLVPAVLLLVPGSIGFRSITSFLAQDVVQGITIAFEMALVAVSLAAGLLVASVVVRPRRSL